MRLTRGRTIQDVLDDRHEMAADRGPLLTVFERVCEAVAYAHAKGVAQRDLKSAHVMIGAFGEVQLLGWGYARVFGGSPPEQADGGAADCRADVFGLGGILWAALTGRPDATSRLDKCEAGPALVALTKRCLSPDPAGRRIRAVADRFAESRRGVG
jgi:serine/threonine protein kinase